MHFFTISFSTDYTGSEQQLLGIFIWGSGGRSHFNWQKCLVFTASVAMTALTGRCKQRQGQTGATYTYLHL